MEHHQSINNHWDWQHLINTEFWIAVNVMKLMEWMIPQVCVFLVLPAFLYDHRAIPLGLECFGLGTKVYHQVFVVQVTKKCFLACQEPGSPHSRSLFVWLTRFLRISCYYARYEYSWIHSWRSMGNFKDRCWYLTFGKYSIWTRW